LIIGYVDRWVVREMAVGDNWRNKYTTETYVEIGTKKGLLSTFTLLKSKWGTVATIIEGNFFSAYRRV